MQQMPSEMTTVHYGFDEIGIRPMNVPDCQSVYIVQDAYTRQFYADSHDKFLAIATQSFPKMEDAYSYTRNHGVIDTLTAIVCLTYDKGDCSAAERKQFDALVGKELARMLTKGDRE